jgi:energy-coupling factor transporter ATP-binding protein EcfA2
MSTLSYSDLTIFHENLKFNEPLESPYDPYYKNYLKESANDPIEELHRIIKMAQNDSVNLLSGQRGSGKTTELHRLRYLLEDDGYIVFISDMRDYINLDSPIEITDLLISMMLALNEAVLDKYGKNIALPSYAERIQDFLHNEIEFTAIEWGFLKISLRRYPSIKQRLQTALRDHVTTIVQQAHDFSQEVMNFIREKTDNKIVFLIDSLEQMRGVGEKAHLVHKSLENLFSQHSDKLHLKNFNTVYTVPPYLPVLANLGLFLDGAVIRSIDNIHVFQRDGKVDPMGLSIMIDIIQLRFSNWQQIFSQKQLEHIILVTGGDFRDFFRLIREVIVKIPLKEAKPLLPVEDYIIDQAKNNLRRGMLPISEEDKIWLRKIAKSKQSELQSIKDLPRFARFFDLNEVHNYRNGEDWYDIHPLLKEAINQ